MKIADFFVQITAKGDLKELKMIADAQKAIKEQSKMAIAAAKVKVAELKKETVEIQKQAKVQAKQPKNLKDMLISALGLNKAFVGIAGSVLLTAIALDKMVTKLAQANQLYTNFQRQTGMPMGRAMGVAGAMANLDVTMNPQEIMQNMQNLQSNLIGVQFGMGNIAPYQMAGINPFGINSANMMDVIRKQLKGFAPAYRTFLLQQMGLDPRLGALIDLSDTEYLKYKQEALELYLSPEDRKTIQELAPEWNKVNLKFAKAWDKTTLFLMQDFLGLAKEVGHVIDVITRAIEVTREILRPVMDVLTMVLKPLYYLLDDIAVWLLGGESVIGDMIHGIFPTKDEWAAMFKDALGNPISKFAESVTNAYKNPFWLKPFRYAPLDNAYQDALSKANMPKFLQTGNNTKVMNNEINISVGSVSDGVEMSNQMSATLNSIMAQKW